MTKRLTVDDDIPALLEELRQTQLELYGDEDWVRDRNKTLRGALRLALDEASEQLADHERANHLYGEAPREPEAEAKAYRKAFEA